MKRALEEQMKRNQEELEEMKKSYEERMNESQTASAVSNVTALILWMHLFAIRCLLSQWLVTLHFKMISSLFLI